MNKKSIFRLSLVGFLVMVLTGLGGMSVAVNAGTLPQQVTPPLPTVTGTPRGPYVTVRQDQEQYINVRSGPGTFYEKVGVLLIGQQLPAKGRSVGGDWILVEYPGVAGGMAWVYGPFIFLSAGYLPIVEPPPTPTPQTTATIDPTLANQYIVTAVPTRLPTFTPPPALVIPTFTAIPAGGGSGTPMGLIIIILGAAGLFIGLFTLAQGR